MSATESDEPMWPTWAVRGRSSTSRRTVAAVARRSSDVTRNPCCRIARCPHPWGKTLPDSAVVEHDRRAASGARPALDQGRSTDLQPRWRSALHDHEARAVDERLV